MKSYATRTLTISRRAQNFSPKVWLTRDLTEATVLVYLVPAEKVLAMDFEYSVEANYYRRPAFGTVSVQYVELADQISKFDRVVAGHL